MSDDDTEPDDETLYIRPATSGMSITKYHEREECPALAESDPRSVTRETVDARELTLCGQCERWHDGGPDGVTQDQDWSAYRALRNAAERRAND